MKIVCIIGGGDSTAHDGS